MLFGGVSILALTSFLGHADPAFTLRVYSHLMPDDETPARSVMDAAHGEDVAQVLPMTGMVPNQAVSRPPRGRCD